MGNCEKRINIIPLGMNVQLMERLEKDGLIIRICHRSYFENIKKDEVKVKLIYSCNSKSGPHSLCYIKSNKQTADCFEAHSDNEDWFLISNDEVEDTFLMLSKLSTKDLKEKIENKKISGNDFIALKMKFNDPEVSFFTIIKNVPHLFFSRKGMKDDPSWYITLSKDIGMDYINLVEYHFNLVY